MGAVKIYSLKEVLASYSTATVSIPNLLAGAAKEGTVVIAQEGDDPIVAERGVDGETCLSSSGAPMFTIKIKLMQTSNVNDLLTVAHQAAVNAPAMLGGIGPLSIKDPNGTKVFFDSNAYIVKTPEITLENKVSFMEWLFSCPNLAWLGGGNAPI